jgi:membrane-associated protein
MVHFHIDSLVLHYIAFWKPLAYAILFFGMIIEGEAFLFIAAFLSAQGFLDTGAALFFLFTGVQLGDSFWYWLGHKINHSDTRVGRWLVKLTGPFDGHLKEKTLRTIVLSKFIVGFHHFILARAGVLKINFYKFLKYDFFSNIIWIAIVGGLGYFSGTYFLLVKHFFRFAEYGLIGGLLFYFILNFLVVKYSIKKKL